VLLPLFLFIGHTLVEKSGLLTPNQMVSEKPYFLRQNDRGGKKISEKNIFSPR